MKNLVINFFFIDDAGLIIPFECCESTYIYSDEPYSIFKNGSMSAAILGLNWKHLMYFLSK